MSKKNTTQYKNLSLRNLMYRLRAFSRSFEKEVMEIITDYEDVIVQLVREQLWAGETGLGRPISPPYAPRTIKRKQRKGQPYDRVTLKDTGKFYGSFRVERRMDGLYVVSTDEKQEYLVERYGTSIFRLSDENLNYFLNTYVRPGIRDKVRRMMDGTDYE